MREFSVVSAERGSESFSFQLKQNITYHDCRHDNRAAALETLQITMERVLVMYVKEERTLRYAITNKISPVGGKSSQVRWKPRPQVTDFYYKTDGVESVGVIFRMELITSA